QRAVVGIGFGVGEADARGDGDAVAGVIRGFLQAVIDGTVIRFVIGIAVAGCGRRGAVGPLDVRLEGRRATLAIDVVVGIGAGRMVAVCVHGVGGVAVIRISVGVGAGNRLPGKKAGHDHRIVGRQLQGIIARFLIGVVVRAAAAEGVGVGPLGGDAGIAR